MNRLLVVGALIRAILAGIAMLVGLCPVVCASDRDAVPDVKCVVVGIRMLQLTEPQQRTAGMMLAVYYLGRLDAGEPDTQVDGLIEIEAEKMTAAEFRSNAVRCGKALSMKGREIEMIGANLSNKAQGGGPPK